MNKTWISLAPNTASPPTTSNSIVAPSMMKTNVGFFSWKLSKKNMMHLSQIIFLSPGIMKSNKIKYCIKMETWCKCLKEHVLICIREWHTSSQTAFGMSLNFVPKSGLVVALSSFPESYASDIFVFWSSLYPLNHYKLKIWIMCIQTWLNITNWYTVLILSYYQQILSS